MNKKIQEEMEIIWAGEDEYSIDQRLEALERIKKIATKNDLPQLIELLESDRNDFWTRELLSEPIIALGGPDYLPQLFEALVKNKEEGHDNDSFNFFLVEMAKLEPEKCKQKLVSLLSDPDFEYKKSAEWLLTFCE